MKRLNIVLLIAASLFLSACGDKLVFVTKTSIGVDIGLNGADNGAHIGFRRFEGVVDPLEGCTDKDCTKGKKAQSLLAKLNFGLNQEKQNDSRSANLAQWIATGDAATILAYKNNIASALTGKDIKLASNFQQGISSSELSLWNTIYKTVKDSKKYDAVINFIDKKSKIIVEDMFVISSGDVNNCCYEITEKKIIRVKDGTFPFPFLTGEYIKCDKRESRCNLKKSEKNTELTREIDQGLGKSLIDMLESLKEVLTKEK